MSDRENAPVFKKFYDLTLWLMDRVERYPRMSRLTLAVRIGDLCIETLESIVRALYSREKGAILKEVNQNLEVLRILMRLSKDRRHISMSQYEYVTKEINEVGAMIGGWIRWDGRGK